MCSIFYPFLAITVLFKKKKPLKPPQGAEREAEHQLRHRLAPAFIWAWAELNGA